MDFPWMAIWLQDYVAGQKYVKCPAPQFFMVVLFSAHQPLSVTQITGYTCLRHREYCWFCMVLDFSSQSNDLFNYNIAVVVYDKYLFMTSRLRALVVIWMFFTIFIVQYMIPQFCCWVQACKLLRISIIQIIKSDSDCTIYSYLCYTFIITRYLTSGAYLWFTRY